MYSINTTDDISSYNQVSGHYYEDEIESKEKISAISWEYQSANSSLTKQSLLRKIYRRIYQNFANPNIWLATYIYAPDNRVTRYKKLWKSLHISGVSITHTGEEIEIPHSDGSYVGFYGAVKLSELSSQSVLDVICEDIAFFLIMLPTETGIEELCERGWSQTGAFIAPDPKLVSAVAFKGGLIIDDIGSFDEPYYGIAAYGAKEMILQINTGEPL